MGVAWEPGDTAGAFTAKVARNPFSGGRHTEQELKGIQVGKPVNAGTTHHWSRQVDTKLCGSLPWRESFFVVFLPPVLEKSPFQMCYLTNLLRPGLQTVLFLPATLTKLCRECPFLPFPKAIQESRAISLGFKK